METSSFFSVAVAVEVEKNLHKNCFFFCSDFQKNNLACFSSHSWNGRFLSELLLALRERKHSFKTMLSFF